MEAEELTPLLRAPPHLPGADLIREAFPESSVSLRPQLLSACERCQQSHPELRCASFDGPEHLTLAQRSVGVIYSIGCNSRAGTVSPAEHGGKARHGAERKRSFGPVEKWIEMLGFSPQFCYRLTLRPWSSRLFLLCLYVTYAYAMR